MDAMHLTEKERETLEYYMSGWKRSEVAKLLALSLNGMDYRKLRIRYKYNTYIGNSNILRLSLFAVYWAVRPKKFCCFEGTLQYRNDRIDAVCRKSFARFTVSALQ